MQQLTAARAALDGAIQVIVDDLVEECVEKAKRNEPFQKDLTGLQAVVAKIR